MHVLTTVAVASPPATCPSPRVPRAVEVTLVARTFGPSRTHGQDGLATEIEPGAAVVQSVEAARDLLRPMMMGANTLPSIESGQVDDTGSWYLVVWWQEPVLRYPVVETVWVRPAETLVSLLSSPRERDRKPRAVEQAVANAVQVFRLPPGDYPPAGIVFTEVQWPADE